ncbi:MAG: hypothetical protein M3123_05885, partial [Actinomycetota bacterium]|nr:hypothetical protein [Actinomycetota bacterium]
YHDFSDPRGGLLSLGDDAGEKLGPSFAGLHVVAVGAPVHEGKSGTVILAHNTQPMEKLQRLVGSSL